MAFMTLKHRVILDHRVYKALQAEALVKESSLQDTMNTLILSNLSQEAKMILETIDNKEYMVINNTNPSIRVSTKSTKPKQLARDMAAVSRIKNLWTSSDMTVVDIAKEIEAPRQTVEALIKRLIERGELASRAKSGQQTN